MKKLILVLFALLVLAQVIPAQPMFQKFEAHTAYVNAVCFSPGGRFIASGGMDGTIKIWDSRTGKLLNNINSDFKIYKLAFSGDSKQICVGTEPLYGISTTFEPFIFIYNIYNGTQDKKFNISGKSPNFFVSDKENKLICISPELYSDSCDYSYDYTLKRYAVANCNKVILKSYDLSENTLKSYPLNDKIHFWDFNSPWYISNEEKFLVLSPLSDESKIITGERTKDFDKKINTVENGNLVYFFDLKENKLIKKIKIIDSYLRLKSVLLTEDCKYFIYTAIEYFNDVIKILNIEKDEDVLVLKGHDREILCLAIHPNGRFLASGSKDNTIRIWDLLNGKTIKILEGHQDNVNYLSFSPDGRYLSSASDDKTVMVWDLKEFSKDIENYFTEYNLKNNNKKLEEENSPFFKEK